MYKILLFAGTTSFILLLLNGCQTADPDQEHSDLPWNTPQSWEGSPSVPGMSPGRY